MIAQARSAMLAVLLLMWTACSLPPCAAQSDPVRTLDPEVVVGHRKQVRADPEVFSPLHNKLWLAGFKETFPSEIPEELKDVDALTRARKLGRLVACADAWYYPFSVTARKTEPPGIDIEIVRAIAARQGWTVQIVWANTGPGAALDVAFRRTIDKGYCDFFTGLIITGEDDDVRRHKLMFTEPYIGMGFVLVTQGAALHVHTLEDIKRENIKIGVLMFSPMENYIRMNDIPHELYFQNQRLIDGMVKGQVDAAMMWSGALATLKRDYEADFDMVSGYVPSPDQRWNGAWALPVKEKELKQFFDEQFATLLKDGEIQRIVERYGVPFYPPFNEK